MNPQSKIRNWITYNVWTTLLAIILLETIFKLYWILAIVASSTSHIMNNLVMAGHNSLFRSTYWRWSMLWKLIGLSIGCQLVKTILSLLIYQILANFSVRVKISLVIVIVVVVVLRGERWVYMASIWWILSWVWHSGCMVLLSFVATVTISFISVNLSSVYFVQIS